MTKSLLHSEADPFFCLLDQRLTREIRLYAGHKASSPPRATDVSINITWPSTSTSIVPLDVIHDGSKLDRIQAFDGHIEWYESARGAQGTSLKAEDYGSGLYLTVSM